MDSGHPALDCPCLYHTEESGGNSRVVDKIDPAETHEALAPLLYVAAVQDGGHAPNDMLILVGQPETGIAILEGGVLIAAQSVELVEHECGYPEGVVPVELEGKTDEGFQFLEAGNFLDLDGHDKYPFLMNFKRVYHFRGE